MDDFLEIPLEQEPLVLFHCDLYEADSDTLVLIGIENPDIYNGLDSITLRFYLKNDNKALSIINDSDKSVTNFLPIAEINAATDPNFERDFPELREMVVFGAYLEGMHMEENELEMYQALEDGDYRNITLRNAKMINDRQIYFISREVDKKQSRYYKKLVDDTFSLKD